MTVQVDTSPKPFVFVLMPFEDAFNDIYLYGIKQTCSDAGAYAERVDEQSFDERILDRIYNQIAKADIVISDMTGQNPNVFYETGYAHALDKRVILLTQNTDDIPFDLKHHAHVVYDGSIEKLNAGLSEKIRWAIENPKRDIAELTPPVEFFINRIPLRNNPCFLMPYDQKDYLRILVDAFNSTDRGIRPTTFRIAVQSSDLFSHTWEDHRRGGLPAAMLPDGGRMHTFSKVHEVMPGGWISWVRLDLGVSPEQIAVGSEHQFVLRMLTEGKPMDFPFRISIAETKNANEDIDR